MLMNDINDKIYLTKQGKETLRKELNELVAKKRPQSIKRVAQAREMGDLMENTEYANARDELAMLEDRIEELEGLLEKAELIREINNKCKKVSLGCKVTVKVNKETHVYTVVGEWEANPLAKKISHSSPLGKALLGKTIGENVEIEAPVGKIVYQIRAIE